MKYCKSNSYRILKFVLLSVIFSAVSSCKSIYNADYEKPELVDKKLSKSTKILHKKLFFSSKKGIAIGHQDATSYGLGWKHDQNPEIIKSDVKKVTGDFPAVFGFDIGHLELGHKYNLDSVPFDTMRELIIDAYKKGGIITISWHLDNPTSNGNSWDKTPAVQDIIEGGKYHNKYKLWVERVAIFIKSLKYKGKKVPIIFRPFHEMNGHWFWWGEGNCTSDDYIKLWRQTVKLLRDKHKLHNLLYAYSPNKLNTNDVYLKYYPGDDYVDLLGIDIYDFINSEDYIKSVVNDLNLVKNIASQKKKLYAFTETGLEAIPTPNWYSDVLYPNIKDTGIAWILFWRNYNTTHHYMPYSGHSSEEDFKKFKSFSKTLFLKDINKVNLN